MADRHDGYWALLLIGIIACGHASARKCDTIVIFANGKSFLDGTQMLVYSQN